MLFTQNYPVAVRYYLQCPDSTIPAWYCKVPGSIKAQGHVLTGRNYDFKNDTSAMLVHCRPAKGYESVATAALDNIALYDLKAEIR